MRRHPVSQRLFSPPASAVIKGQAGHGTARHGTARHGTARHDDDDDGVGGGGGSNGLALIHNSEPTTPHEISVAVLCLKKKKNINIPELTPPPSIPSCIL